MKLPRLRRLNPFKKRRLLIHIGMPKTGSTSIQETLCMAAGQLSAIGIDYPRLSKQKNHQPLLSVYVPYERTSSALHNLGPDRYAEMARKYRATFYGAVAESRMCIVSAENLWRLTPSDVAMLARDLDAVGWDDVRVIAYVREPASHYLSAIQQAVKNWPEFEAPQDWRCDSYAALQAWNTCFDVQARVFERSALHQGSVVHDFLNIASDFFNAPLREIEVVNANESISAEAMVACQRFLRTVRPDNHSRRRAIAFLKDASSRPGHTKPKLRADIGRAVRANHRYSLEGLRIDYGINFGSPGDIDAARLQTPVRDVVDVLDYHDAALADRLYEKIAMAAS